MDTAYDKCLYKLLECFNQKGYLLFDDIIALTDKYDLSLTDLDRINEDILLRGAVIFEEPPEDLNAISNDNTFKDADYSRADYEKVYMEIEELEPGLADFIEYIKGIRPPQHGELKYLIEQYSCGDFSARDRMINMYLRNVCKTALWYANNTEINICDAISAGSIGLINAINNVSPNGEMQFKTSLNYYIQNGIARESSPDWIDYYYPVHMKDAMIPEFIEYKQLNGVNSYKEIDWSVADFEKSFKSANKYLQQVLIQVSKMSYEDMIENGYDKQSNFDMEKVIENKSNEELKIVIDSILESLTEREREVLTLRTGLNGKEPLTLEQVGEKFNVTRERIRQIEVKAKRKVESKIRHNHKYRWLINNNK